MPSIEIPRALYEEYAGTLEARVAEYDKALSDFALTVNVPRPTEVPLVERIVASGGMHAVHIVDPEVPPEPEKTLYQRRIDAVARIEESLQKRLVTGLLFHGHPVQATDQARADIDGLLHAAVLALAGSLRWEPPFDAWIGADNEMIALETPDAAIELGQTVGGWYGRLRLHVRDLKNAALVSDQPEGIDLDPDWEP